jgi:hypothetical protein
MSRSFASIATIAAIAATAFAAGTAHAVRAEIDRCRSGTLEPGDGSENPGGRLTAAPVKAADFCDPPASVHSVVKR